MRVVHVIPSLASRTGGPAFAVVGASRALRELGVESTVVTTDLGGAAAGPRRRVDAGQLPPGADELDVRVVPSRRPARLAFAPGLARALKAAVADADVVHVHSLYLLPQLSGYRAARGRGLPYVVSPHGALDPWLRARGRVRKRLVDLLWQERLLARAAALHVTTEEEARLLADVAPGVPRAVVPIGISWEDFGRLPATDGFRERVLQDRPGYLVLFLGRITAKKGLDVLIEGFARAEVTDSLLAVAGPDDEGLRPGLEALAERAGVGSRVLFTGMLDGRDKLAALASADVWALPSHTENFGLAVVEAFAASRPVLISPAVNIAPEARAAGAAAIADPTPHAFGSALASLLTNPELRAELSGRARRFARRYDWSEVAPSWRTMYEQAAGR
jgi:glycosyltransferase involved in cell wall biosynthesis